MPNQIIMYVVPTTGNVHLVDPGNESTVYVPYELTFPFSVNSILKGLNATSGLTELGDKYIVKLIINIPQ